MCSRRRTSRLGWACRLLSHLMTSREVMGSRGKTDNRKILAVSLAILARPSGKPYLSKTPLTVLVAGFFLSQLMHFHKPSQVVNGGFCDALNVEESIVIRGINPTFNPVYSCR